jgi:hypothetical protein
MQFISGSKKTICYLAVTFMTLSVQACTTDVDTHKVKNEAPVYSLTANSLFAEYKANEVAADEKFKDKIVVVKGKIVAIGKDVVDQAYVVIGGEGMLDGVQCTFTKGENGSVAALSKGRMATIKGQVTGKMGNVQINKSSLL